MVLVFWEIKLLKAWENASTEEFNANKTIASNTDPALC